MPDISERIKQRLNQSWVWERSCPDDLRKAGLTVAVHNDYMLEGNPHTFWLLTIVRDGKIFGFKGEGETDQEALDFIRAKWAEFSDSLHHAPACPANHYSGQRAPTGPCNCGAKETTKDHAGR